MVHSGLCWRRAFVLATCATMVAAIPINTMMLRPPYANGELPGWKKFGDIHVDNQLLHLSTQGSHPNTRSAVWTDHRHNMNEFSLVYKVAVKGAGHPDAKGGLGIWVTDAPQYTEGDLYGITARFSGFGLVFNSYAGSERDQAYKEIRLFTNKDGSVDTKDLMKSELGCKIPLKAKRDGGSEVTIKMMYYQGMLFVLYDSAGDGMWAECLTQPLDLNEHTLENAHLGLSGFSTTHPQDVQLLSLVTDTRWDESGMAPDMSHPSENSADREQDDAARRAQNEPDPNGRQLTPEEQLHKMQLHEWASEQRLEKLERKINTALQQRLDQLESSVHASVDNKLFDRVRDLETQFRASAESALTNRIAQIEEQLKVTVEEKLMVRVAALEQQIKGKIATTEASMHAGVESKIASRLQSLEGTMKESLKGHIASEVNDRDQSTRKWVGQLAQKLDARANQGVQQLHAHVEGAMGESGTQWQTPFVALLVVMAVVAAGAFKWYTNMKKTHLL